jgi:hypothetical protein
MTRRIETLNNENLWLDCFGVANILCGSELGLVEAIYFFLHMDSEEFEA